MAPTEVKPEYVVFTRPTNVTGEEILITNKGIAFVRGSDSRTGAKTATLVGGKFIIRR